MKKMLLSVSIVLLSFIAKSQLLTWSPQFPNDNSTIVITMDATKGNKSLQGFAGSVYMHLGVITSLSTSNTDWKYVSTVWATTTAPAATSLGNDKWSFTLTNPRAYFNAAGGGVPGSETIIKIAILFRDGAGNKIQKNADNSDMYVPIYPAGSNSIIFTTPGLVPTFNMSNELINTTLNQQVAVTAVASTSAGSLKLYFNGTQVGNTVAGSNTISGSSTIVQAGTQRFVAEVILNGTSYFDTLQFYVPPVNVILPLPAGVKEGINYWPACDSVTLVLYAPNKQNAVLLGDFQPNAWLPQAANQMYRTADGIYYWITLKGLTPGFEYSFQYLVDNTIYIADPYSEKVLDPWNDKYISTATYPGLKPYPTDANVNAGTNGYISVFKTCPTAYNWKVTNFVKPDKRNLVTYELLVRDFGDAHNYQLLIDSINYFKRLSINSIELMPVNEFSGNESWGYNPTFYCALDKAYGTKDKFKEFIDLCHQNGIAIILDVVYNHMDAYNAPQGKLYWDAAAGKPAANSPWFNQTAPHPYGVFEDLNHTSIATQNLVKRALEYWIQEYKVDGYRFDLAKGFTQKVTDGTTVEDFDGSRLTNLNRYYDYVVPKYPETYMILEFLGQQRTEEQQYANKGFLLWSNSNYTYSEASKGFGNGSDFSKVMFNSSQSNFSRPAAFGYMDSHDEERVMVRTIQNGNQFGGYDVKNLATALERQAATAAVFFTTPGPKMIWQFGERGYDVSINFGGDRVASKPPRWEQMLEPNRIKLYNIYSKLINLRISNADVFNSTNFNYDFYDNNGLYKRCQITDNAANGLKINAVANLDVVAQTRNIGFQATGDWYNYVSNGSGAGFNGGTDVKFNIATNNQNITLQPGEYHVYIYHPANVYMFIGGGNWNDPANWTYNTMPPAVLPSGSEILVNPSLGSQCVLNVTQSILPGAKITVMAGKKLLIPLNLAISNN